MNKYCRICWNVDNWRHPSGKAELVEQGGSYAATHRFGHEEWLFNFGWLLKGYTPNDANSYRYAFLQPIGKFLTRYQGQTFSVLLYTVSPERQPLLVAQINGLYVPDNKELDWALKQARTRGWLKTMREDLTSLGIDDSPLVNPSPSSITNVRFRPQDVTFFDPRPVVVGTHKIARTRYYQPFDWTEDFPPTTIAPLSVKPPVTPDADDDSTRSEAQRTRSATESVSYDPRHTQLQNRLFRDLRSQYGASAVRYEDGFVDLVLRRNGKTVFIEIKMELTVKRCIRLAVGQLLEYAHYPSVIKADHLIVVGDTFPTKDDASYLAKLRDLYGLPLYYARWDWDKECLDVEI